MNLTPAACTPIRTGHILAADLARAVPEFAALPGDVEVGSAPVPGSRRVLHAAELRRLAAKFNITLAPDTEACFEWTLRPVSPADVVRAMREALELPNAQVRIIEIGTHAAPEGDLIFPLQGLAPAADRNNGPALWRGYIAYSEKRRFDLWVRVKLSAPTSRVIAVTSIAAGHAIKADEVRLDTVEDYPIWHEVARSPDQVVGRVARRGIPAGRAILQTELTRPFEIEAGELVEVSVHSGKAHLTMQGQAENSGRTGDMIGVRNPRSGKLFRARVEAKGKVLVLPGITGGMVN